MSKELLPRSNAQVGYENIELNNQKHKLKHKNHWRNLKLKSLSAVIETTEHKFIVTPSKLFQSTFKNCQ